MSGVKFLLDGKHWQLDFVESSRPPCAFWVELILTLDSHVLWLNLQFPLRHGRGLSPLRYIRRVDDVTRREVGCSPPICVCPLPNYLCHNANTLPLPTCAPTPAMTNRSSKPTTNKTTTFSTVGRRFITSSRSLRTLSKRTLSFSPLA